MGIVRRAVSSSWGKPPRSRVPFVARLVNGRPVQICTVGDVTARNLNPPQPSLYPPRALQPQARAITTRVLLVQCSPLCLLITLSGSFGVGKVTIIGASDSDVVQPAAQSGLRMLRSQNTTPITRRR